MCVRVNDDLPPPRRNPETPTWRCKLVDPRPAKGYKTTAYVGNTCSNNSNPNRIESSVNFIPNQPCADGDHVPLRIVVDLREFLQANMNTGGRRESGICPMATTFDLQSLIPEH